MVEQCGFFAPPPDEDRPVRTRILDNYAYELLESGAVIVYKDGDESYRVNPGGACECIGYQHRQECKHSHEAALLRARHRAAAA